LVAQNWTECSSSLHMGTPLRSLTVPCVSCGRSSGLVGPILVQTAVLCVVRARVWIWGHFRVQMAACSGRVARTQLPFGGVVSWRNRGCFGGPHDGTDGFGRRFWACSGRVAATQLPFGGVLFRRNRAVFAFGGRLFRLRTTVGMDFGVVFGPLLGVSQRRSSRLVAARSGNGLIFWMGIAGWAASVSRPFWRNVTRKVSQT